MKKIVFATITVLFLSFMLISCSNNSSTKEGKNDSTTNSGNKVNNSLDVESKFLGTWKRPETKSHPESSLKIYSDEQDIILETINYNPIGKYIVKVHEGNLQVNFPFVGLTELTLSSSGNKLHFISDFFYKQ